jgi:two-component system phosphate regulon sensor histidine kinase PhoR
MKKSRFQLLIFISTLVCLTALTAIQINWIIKAAGMQEAQFAHSVNMAMNRIVENLSRDKVTCSELAHCMKEGTSGSCYIMMKNREEWANIGNLIKSDLKYYGIELDFEFDIVGINPDKVIEKNSSVYFSDDLVDALQQTGSELRIRFPEKRDFIMAQIGYIFIFSIILLILVSLSIILIYGFYKKEKKLTENIVDFINNMTHEFKTPLTNISLANSMIYKTETVEQDKKLTFYSQVIKTEHNKLRDHVEKLLKNSFSETGQPSYNETIDPLLVIENVIDTYSVQISEKKGRISLINKGESRSVCGNVDMFHIAIGNIVDNATRYSILPPEIRITIFTKNRNITIEIGDNGIGMTKDQITQIFDKFYRVPTGDIHNTNGFGLGLYHVKNIITKMGGKVTVTSSKGNGSCFSIILPIMQTDEN